jgi:hypothetical protein
MLNMGNNPNAKAIGQQILGTLNGTGGNTQPPQGGGGGNGNLFTPTRVTDILDDYGYQGNATGGTAQSFIDSNPQAKAAYMAAVQQAKAGNNAALTDQTGVVPATAEPLHRFEKEALTSLGSGNPAVLRQAGIDPRTTQFLDRFGGFSDEAAGMIRSGTQGFDQGEFDQYSNPYNEQVTERSVDRLNEQAQEMRANLLRSQSSNRGNASFGDLYGAQRMGDIDREQIQTTGDITAQGNQAGFNTALEALFKQRGNQLQGGNIMGGMGGQFVNAAGQAQSIANSGFNQATSAIQNQGLAGTAIRGYNQNLADQTFANMSEPTRFSNAQTATALEATPGVIGRGANYTTPPVDRFGQIATGVAGAAEELGKIRF